MHVTRSKHASSAGKATHSPREKRFDKAWKQVIRQQKDNDHFREEAKAFARDARVRLESDEQAHLEAMYDLSLHLISFFSRKSLAQWQRETLIDWVGEYLVSMRSNPFGAHLELLPIAQCLEKELINILPGSKKAPEPSDNDPFLAEGSSVSEDEDPVIQDMFQELFSEFDQAEAKDDAEQSQYEDEMDSEFLHGFFEEQKAYEQLLHDESQELKQLMRSSSVNRLFRKVAGVLHPDKEQDETARHEKNRLMSELIQARDNNDIPRIFEFYAKHVGQSPLKELGQDLDGVTQLLERQYLYLIDQKEDILDEDPFTALLYRRFHRNSPQATRRVVDKHLRETRSYTDTLFAMRESITSLKTLKPYLEFRFDSQAEDDFEVGFV